MIENVLILSIYVDLVDNKLTPAPIKVWVQFSIPALGHPRWIIHCNLFLILEVFSLDSTHLNKERYWPKKKSHLNKIIKKNEYVFLGEKIVCLYE